MLTKEQADKLVVLIDEVRFAASENARAMQAARTAEQKLATDQLRLDNFMKELQSGPAAPVKRKYERKAKAAQPGLLEGQK